MTTSTVYQDGAAIPGLYPANQAAVLAATALASGVPTPPTLAFSAVPMSPANTPVILLQPNAGRTFLLIYNPNVMVMQFSLGIANYGAISNLAIGPGQANFWANAQGLAPVYQGGLTAVGQIPQLALWVWQDGSNLYNNGGTLAIQTPPADYPIVPNGLPPGAVWLNGLELTIIPGITPDPAAAPQFFGSITAEELLNLGGGNLPLTNPGAGKLQLWNDGGVVAIS